MDLKNISESKKVRNIIITIGIIIVVLSILFVGMNIGEHRARFASEFGNNYERNFVGPINMMGGNFGRMMPNGNGAVGKIVSLNLPQIVVSGPDNLEKTVIISASTTIREFQQNLKNTDLKVGDSVIVIGNPNTTGQIEAGLIRVMPAK